MKFFVDTDVTIDLLAARSPYFEEVLPLFKAIEHREFEAGIASLSFSTAYYIVEKKLGHAVTMGRLQGLQRLLLILSVDQHVIGRALRSGFGDFEDAIQHECACFHGMDCIVTRNFKDFKESKLPVYGPSEALRRVRRGL